VFREFHDAQDVAKAEKGDRSRHARNEAWRVEERPRRQGRQSEQSKAAIAIALHEAGASKYESKKENEKSLAKTERKQAEGKTYQQEAEGKSHVGASGRRESSREMGGENAARPTARGLKSARARARNAGGATKEALYQRAKAAGIAGRSKMTKQQLENALHH
jgi:hypothetical protein